VSKNKKEDILSAAEKVFQQKGYKNASITKIAKEAGVSLGTLYAYFQSKKLLFEAIRRPELREYNPEEEKRKQTIIDTALKTFAQKGYSSTTMDTIAASCGYSKTIVYQYFTSKEDLFGAVFSQIDLLKGYSDMTFRSTDVSLHEFLKKTGTRFLELFEDPNRLSLMRIVISEIHLFPQMGEIMYMNTVDRAANEVAEHLARYADSFIIQKVDVKLAARSFLGLLYSFVLSDEILNPSTKQFNKEEIIDFAVSLFENGLRMKSGSE